jgi:hypothetical protein
MKKKILLFAALSGLAASTASAQFINIQSSGMETWHDTTISGMTFTAITLQAPENWHGSDLLVASFADIASLAGMVVAPAQQIFQSSDAHGGQYAAEIKTEFLGDSVGIMTGAFSNAEFQFDIGALVGGTPIDEALGYSGGEPITAQVDSVSAWIKMDANNTDDGAILVQAVKTYQGSNGDSTVAVGEGYFTIPSATTTTYTQFAVPLNYPDPNAVPDHLVVVFTSSSIIGTQTVDNSMKVDDVSYSYAGPNSIWQPLFSEKKLLVYPVPASTLVYFNLGANEDPSQYHLQISDLQGRLISEKQLTTTVNAENVSKLARGTYFYSLSNLKTGLKEQGKFILK